MTTPTAFHEELTKNLLPALDAGLASFNLWYEGIKSGPTADDTATPDFVEETVENTLLMTYIRTLRNLLTDTAALNKLKITAGLLMLDQRLKEGTNSCSDTKS